MKQKVYKNHGLCFTSVKHEAFLGCLQWYSTAESGWILFFPASINCRSSWLGIGRFVHFSFLLGFCLL